VFAIRVLGLEEVVGQMCISARRDERVRRRAGGGSEIWNREYSLVFIDGSRSRLGIMEEGSCITSGAVIFVYPKSWSLEKREEMCELYIISAINITLVSFVG